MPLRSSNRPKLPKGEASFLEKVNLTRNNQRKIYQTESSKDSMPTKVTNLNVVREVSAIPDFDP